MRFNEFASTPRPNLYSIINSEQNYEFWDNKSELKRNRKPFDLLLFPMQCFDFFNEYIPYTQRYLPILTH